MVYTYTPTYYSSLQDTITSICKSILLPLSLKSRRLPAEQKLAKRHADSLKWQQESFHRILHLIGLHKEGMVPESEVAAFRSHLLDTLIASPADQEPGNVIRDKLLFLQELFYAKCISTEEYHSSKRPLLQRLAVQGAEIDCRDVIVGEQLSSEEEWSVIELGDDERQVVEEKPKHRTPLKSLWKAKGKKEEAKPCNQTPSKEREANTKNASILMPEGSPAVPIKSEKPKRKAFRSLFQKEEGDDKENNKNLVSHQQERVPKSSKKQWGFDAFKKWRRSDCEDESMTPCLLPMERSDDDSSVHCELVASPIGEGPDTKQIKKKIHADGSSSDFFIDKVLGDNIKRELSRIQSELCATNPNLNFSNDQIEAISTRLPVEKEDLQNVFPKSWCDRYGDIVLDVVRKEFKDHVGEMETMRNAAKERQGGPEKWVAFEQNDENFHPNLFSQHHQSMNGGPKLKDTSYASVNNPFPVDQNPFWTLEVTSK